MKSNYGFEHMEKKLFEFTWLKKYSKFWSFLQDNFIKHKPLIPDDICKIIYIDFDSINSFLSTIISYHIIKNRIHSIYMHKHNDKDIK